MGIKHRYTQVRVRSGVGSPEQSLATTRPQTNGKVERLNRTISEEFLTKVKFENRLQREAELRLWEYYYNRQKSSLKTYFYS